MLREQLGHLDGIGGGRRRGKGERQGYGFDHRRGPVLMVLPL
jgi:hypothetical protein